MGYLELGFLFLLVYYILLVISCGYYYAIDYINDKKADIDEWKMFKLLCYVKPSNYNHYENALASIMISAMTSFFWPATLLFVIYMSIIFIIKHHKMKS
jgi:hypothetical protein